MEPALTPRLALAYLRELSADFRGGAVLDAARAPLAGAPAVAAAAARVVAALDGEAGAAAVPVPGHVVHVARSETHSVVALYGELALPALVAHDLRVALADLRGESAAAGGPGTGREHPSSALREAAEAVFFAVQSGSAAPSFGSER